MEVCKNMASQYPAIKFDNMIIDNASMQVIVGKTDKFSLNFIVLREKRKIFLNFGSFNEIQTVFLNVAVFVIK